MLETLQRERLTMTNDIKKLLEHVQNLHDCFFKIEKRILSIEDKLRPFGFKIAEEELLPKGVIADE